MLVINQVCVIMYVLQVRPNYIASGTDGSHVYCKHGEVECDGNTQQVRTGGYLTAGAVLD